MNRSGRRGGEPLSGNKLSVQVFASVCRRPDGDGEPVDERLVDGVERNEVGALQLTGPAISARGSERRLCRLRRVSVDKVALKQTTKHHKAKPLRAAGERKQAARKRVSRINFMRHREPHQGLCRNTGPTLWDFSTVWNGYTHVD